MPKLLRTFLFLVSLYLFQPVFSGYAQSPIVVTRDELEVQFPDTITFFAEAQSASDIEEVTLIYGTNGRSCQPGGSRQPIDDFEAGTAVSLEWEWELKRSGSLPPGVNVWWQWEIKDADGNTHTTERQEITYQDDRSSWQTISENGVTVKWVRGGSDFGQMIWDKADQALDRLAENMGVPRPDAITLWAYPSAAEMRDALVYSSEWAGGVAFPDYGVTIIGIAPGEEDWAARVIPHELSHLVVGIRVFNCRGVRLPTWLDEGLARYSEDNVAASELSQLEAALADGSLPPLRSLASGFSAYGSSAGLSYTQSYRVVQYLIEEFGPEKMTELLITMQGGKRVDDALQQVYGFDTAGLDAAWRETTGYAATPTSEADALAAQATPTLAPTIALANPLGGGMEPPTATPLPDKTPVIAATETMAPTETAVPTLPSATAVIPTPIPASPTLQPSEIAASPTNNRLLLIGGGLLIIVVLVAFILMRLRRKP